MSKGMLIFAWVAAILVSGLILKFFPAPFVWICLCWCCVFLLVVVLARKTVWKFLALNLGVIFLMLSLVEAFLWVKSKSAVDRNSHYEGSYTNNYFREDNYLRLCSSDQCRRHFIQVLQRQTPLQHGVHDCREWIARLSTVSRNQRIGIGPFLRLLFHLRRRCSR